MPGMCYGRWAPVFYYYFRLIESGRKVSSGRSANSPFEWDPEGGLWDPLGSYVPTFINHTRIGWCRLDSLQNMTWEMLGSSQLIFSLKITNQPNPPCSEAAHMVLLPLFTCTVSSERHNKLAAKSPIGKSDFREGTPHMRHGASVHLFIHVSSGNDCYIAIENDPVEIVDFP